MPKYLVTVSTMQPMCYQYVVACKSALEADDLGLAMWAKGEPSHDQWSDEDSQAEVVNVIEYTEVKR